MSFTPLKTIILLILLTLLSPAALSARQFGSDNLVADLRVVDCELQARDGELKSVKVRRETVMSAGRVDEHAVLITVYDENCPVGKASAPGAKPVYRAAETGEIFYSGDRVCLLPFEVKAGRTAKAVVEQTYVSPEYFTEVILGNSHYDTRKVRVVLRIPSELAGRVAVRGLNLPEGVRRDSTADSRGNVTITYEADNVPAFPRERLAPPFASCAPMILVNASFADVGGVFSYLRSRLGDDPDDPALETLARELTAGKDNDMARIDTIAAWVRSNIRYVAIEHGEFGHRPDAPGAVLQKRYGDCKGSATLIRALLRKSGIDGRLVWIGTRGHVPADWSENPSLSAGNHMIAAAVLPDTVVFVDGTCTYAPRGYIPYGIAGRECLMEDGEGYRLTHVPEGDREADVLTHTGRYAVDGSSLTGSARFEFAGVWRTLFEELVNGVTASRRPQLVARLIVSGRNDIGVSDAVMSTAATDAPVSNLSATVSDASAVRAVGGRRKLYVQPRVLRMMMPSAINDNGRSLPVDVGTPMSVRTDIAVEIPEGYMPSGLPVDIGIDNGWFRGRVRYELDSEGGAVRCFGELYPTRLTGPASEAAAWNVAVREVERAANTAIVFERNQ